MAFIKNFFIVFFLSVVFILISKFIFVFYYFENISFSKEIYAILWGYKFDFAVGGILTFLATLFDFNKKSFIFISLLLLISVFLVQISDIMYFYDAQRHISYEVKDALTDASGLISIAFSEHLLLIIVSSIILLILSFLAYYILKSFTQKIQINRYYILKKLLIIAISIFFVRGMFQHIPLNPWQSNQIGNSKLAIISLSGVYNMIYSNIKSKSNIQQKKKYLVDNQDKLVKSLYTNNTNDTKILNNPNIVILFLESWSGTLLKNYGGKYDITPNYDMLLKKSIYPKGMISNGHRTSEGIFSTLTSFQNPLGATIAKTKLQSYKYTSFVDILKKHKNYSSAFFQGTNKETSGVGSLTQNLGFEKSYGKRDIKTRIYEENAWGVHDPDLYNFALKKMNSMKKPFIVGINGATTHDTSLPKEIKKLSFTKDEKLNARLNTFHFSDKSMYDFIKSTEKKYPNTIFVLLADHCGGGIKNSNFLNYLIPFAIYSKNLEARYVDSFISQRDIAPSIIDLVFGDYKKISPQFTGQSIFRKNDFFADYYHNGILGIIKNKKAIEIDANNDIKCYDVSSFKEKNISCNENDIKLKKQVQAFTNISQSLLFKGETENFKNYR